MQTICTHSETTFMPLSHSHFLLDIETTGLSKTNDTILCIGVMFKENHDTINCIRWLIDNKTDEQLLLQHFLSFCSSYSTAFTYNGNSFDIPFIISRLNYYHIDDHSFKNLVFIDFKKALSKIGIQRFLVEQCLGYHRQTTLSGKDLGKLCAAFGAASSKSYKILLLMHNLDELLSLHGMYETRFILNDLTKYRIISSMADDNHLTICLETDRILNTACIVNAADVHISWMPLSNTIKLKLPFYKGKYKKYLSPAKDYYFIKGQNEIVHKSIAQFISKDLKQRVTQKECFVSKDGCFIKLIGLRKKTTELWYNDTGETFVEYLNTNDEYFVCLIVDQIVQFLI